MTNVSRDGSVEFYFYRKGATLVRVVGDFNGPGGGQAQVDMRAEGDGWWRAATRLEAGEYRFLYVADGQPYADYASHGVEMGEGGVTSVLVVPVWQERQSRPEPARLVA